MEINLHDHEIIHRFAGFIWGKSNRSLSWLKTQKPRKGNFAEFQKISRWSIPPDSPHRSLHLRCSFRKSVSIYPRSAPEDRLINGGKGAYRRQFTVFYYINTNKIPAGELLRENMIFSHVKRSPLIWLHNKSCLSQQKAIKWSGLVFYCCLSNK